jgi:crossover junction endodeoxyribonuclease RusA
MLTINLPYPPSVNSYWLTSGRRRYISKRGMEFKSAVVEICQGLEGFGTDMIEVAVIFHPRDKRLMDLDNSLKAIGDSLQDAGMFEDDSQIWKWTIERGEKIKGGGCTVAIKRYQSTI